MFTKQRERIGARFKTQEGAAWIMWCLTAARTVSYFVERQTVLSHLIDRIEEDWLSPSLWAMSWLSLTVAILSRQRSALTVGMGISTAVVFLWGLLYAWSDPIEFFSRGSVYLALCGAIFWGTVRKAETFEEDGDAIGRPTTD